VLAEYNNSGTLLRRYVYGNYIDETLMMLADDAEYYYAHDHLYSPAALMSYEGYDTFRVRERYEYDAYGKCRFYDDTFYAKTSGDYGNPYLFTGRPVDYVGNPIVALQDNRNRWYDSETGRWFTQDPLGITPNGSIGNTAFSPKKQYQDGMSLYEYAKSNSLKNIDVYGLIADMPNLFPYPIQRCGNCGPNVTSLLQNMRMSLMRWFYSNGDAGIQYGLFPPKDNNDRKSLCRGIISLNGWDITELKSEWEGEIRGSKFKDCATGTCGNTVKVGNGCYGKDEVNYYAFGVMASICEQYFPDDPSTSYSEYQTVLNLYLYPYASWRYGWKEGNSIQCKSAWFQAGYNANPLGVSCGNRVPECKLEGCTGCFNQFNVLWKYTNNNSRKLDDLHGAPNVRP
jgi:RHS repeat-associated protein